MIQYHSLYIIFTGRRLTSVRTGYKAYKNRYNVQYTYSSFYEGSDDLKAQREPTTSRPKTNKSKTVNEISNEQLYTSHDVETNIFHAGLAK